MHPPVNYHRNWPFLLGKRKYIYKSSDYLYNYPNNEIFHLILSVSLVLCNAETRYFLWVPSEPSVGIVVPCEGIDQGTKNAAGKACHWALTHRIMLEHHTWRLRSLVEARCEIHWDGDVLMDGNMTQFIILMGSEAATLQALGKKGYLTEREHVS